MAVKDSRKSRDKFVRLDIKFILYDPRCVLLTDSQFRLYMQLSALALQERRDILPPRFTPETVAMLLRTDVNQLRADVTHLVTDADSLLKVVNGCLQVRGMRARYDGRFQWKETPLNPEQSGGWEFATSCIQMHDNWNQMHPDVVDIEKEKEGEKDIPPDPPEGGCPTHQKADVADTLPETPPELLPLKLYAKDEKLCKQWDDLWESWQVAYPGLDIMDQVRRAHAWEIANPSKRKKRRSTFLAKWLDRAQDDWRVKKKIVQLEDTDNEDDGEIIITNAEAEL